MEIEYFRQDAEHYMVRWRRVLIWYSVGEVDRPQVEEMCEYFDVMAQRHPEGFGFCLYAKDTCKLPNSAGRKAASGMFAAQKGRLSGMVALFEGHGFFMVSARAILSTMLAIARQPFETHVSGDPNQAATWICERTPELRDLVGAPAQLEAVLEQLTREHATLVSSAA